MLAIKLFKDNVNLVLISQGKIFAGAIRLLYYAIPPLIIMMLPVVLLLAQMGLWYQARPLFPGEDSLVVMKLKNNPSSIENITIDSNSGVEIVDGPVRIESNNEVLWKIRARENGYHRINFNVDGYTIKKDIAVGDGFMRISAVRPGWQWSDILLHPAEPPFSSTSPIQAISIDYPDRISKINGTDWWIAYFFIASMVFALLFKPVLKVRI